MLLELSQYSVQLIVIDHDMINPHNVPKSLIYKMQDVGRLKVDVVSDWMSTVNSELPFLAIPERVEDVPLGLFVHPHVVLISAVDNYDAKMTLNRIAWKCAVSRFLVGGLMGGSSDAGRYQRFIPQPDLPCLECSWHREYSLQDVSFSCAKPSRGVRTSLSVAMRVASLIVDEVITVITDNPLQIPEEIRISPNLYGVRKLRPTHNPNCLFDHQIPRTVQVDQPIESLSLHDAFVIADDYLPDSADHLLLRQPLFREFECFYEHNWQKWESTPTAPCPTCGEQGFAKDISFHIQRDTSRQSNAILADLVPAGDVLTFATSDGEQIQLALPAPESWSVMNLVEGGTTQ
jgi:molybdopterin/thiamine biosynthesis adenylyltransferase